ncbi:uracil-DNA glycosylase [Synechococcus sp. H55.2]|uniref:uracil-DNA glycosylase n=1 Tax=unclassified Synechococcus TaxID=2626047 RepID=UPI0039C299C9
MRKRSEALELSDWATLQAEIVRCRRCPRLVAWREGVAQQKVARFCDQLYWGRPVPGFGDVQARLWVIGLAPAAHGGNRTGRVFTGDPSGDWLFRALYRAGFANQPTSIHREDGLQLRDCYISAVVRCAPPQNRPTAAEAEACLGYLRQELELLTQVRVILALGHFAFRYTLALLPPLRPRPRFGHNCVIPLGEGRYLLTSYHPSRRNTATKRLTEAMLDAVFERAQQLLSPSPPSTPLIEF